VSGSKPSENEEAVSDARSHHLMSEVSPELALVAPAPERELLLAALPRRDPNAFLVFRPPVRTVRSSRARRAGRLAVGTVAYAVASAVAMTVVGVAIVGGLTAAIAVLELVH
jgi:hypothetical protein